jgi:hypothetical protein
MWNVERFIALDDCNDQKVLVNRTNNCSESLNKKINDRLNKSSPDVVTLVNLLKAIANEYVFDIAQVHGKSHNNVSPRVHLPPHYTPLPVDLTTRFVTVTVPAAAVSVY